MPHGKALLKITVNEYHHSRRMRSDQPLDIMPLNGCPNLHALPGFGK